ncbi:MAG: LuxR C-terminal-related transcriptional regulator [Polyangiaceae bacterium]
MYIRAFDSRALLDASYDVISGPQEWGDALVREMVPLIPRGSQFALSLGRVTDALEVEILRSSTPELTALMVESIPKWSAETNRFLASLGPSFSWLDAIHHHGGRIPSADQERMISILRSARAADVRITLARSVDGTTASIAVLSEKPFSPQAQRELEPWVQLSSHVCAAYRLRKNLAGGQSLSEAIISADGRKIEHAEGAATPADAREALRMAVRSIDRSRGHRSSDPLADLMARKVLVKGRWSLVDQFEADGRRYMVATVNEPMPAFTLLPELAQREHQVALYVALGHSLKHIAYDLGVGISTVAGALRRAQSKLGVSSRAELILLVHRRIEQTLSQAKLLRRYSRRDRCLPRSRSIHCERPLSTFGKSLRPDLQQCGSMYREGLRSTRWTYPA